MATEEELDALVALNTRTPYRLRRAMEIVAAGGEHTLQSMVQAAMTDWLRTFHPRALAAVGNPDWEAEVAGSYLAQKLNK